VRGTNLLRHVPSPIFGQPSIFGQSPSDRVCPKSASLPKNGGSAQKVERGWKSHARQVLCHSGGYAQIREIPEPLPAATRTAAGASPRRPAGTPGLVRASWCLAAPSLGAAAACVALGRGLTGGVDWGLGARRPPHPLRLTAFHPLRARLRASWYGLCGLGGACASVTSSAKDRAVGA
jgi:hypothetical protein